MPALSEKLDVAQCRHGLMCWPKGDGTIGKSLALYGEFAEGENRMMQRYIPQGGTAIDIGANLGTTVLPLARAVGPQGHVLAFEPQPLMAQCLSTSLSLNGLFNVRVMTCAVSDSSGWARIQAPGIDAGGNYGAMSLGKDGLAVPVIRLDELDLPKVDLVKVDVEGFEMAVIRGGQAVLQRLAPVLYLEAKRIQGTVDYLTWLMAQGWRCYWHYAFFFSAVNFRGSQQNIFGSTGDMNILAIPPHKPQPNDLPEIKSPQEDWKKVYVAFFNDRNLPMV